MISVPAFVGICIGALPTFVLGIVGYRINKKTDERYEQHMQEKKEKAEFDMLLLEMVQAGSDLSYACAMALQRGKPNGEVEAGVKAYDQARENYQNYVTRRYVEVQHGL